MPVSLSSLSKAVGSSGTSGYSGYSGTNGVVGVNGDSGVSGYSGTSGYSGVSGYSGTSGTSGAAGPSTTINATANTVSTALYPVMVSALGTDETAWANTKLVYNASTGNFGVGGDPTQRLDIFGNFKLSGAIYENVFTITDSSSVDIDPVNGTIQLWTLGGSRTPTATNFAAGQSITLMINDGTAYTVDWSTIGVVWVGGTAPVLDTTKYTVVVIWKAGANVYGSLVGYA